MPVSRDTIFALASGRGRAGVAIVRLSGPGAGAALAALSGPLPPPRAARLRALADPLDGTLIDRALVLWFPAPASFTGEDVAEFHVHGGPAILSALVGALGRMPGLRHAEAGEFTRSAFENGRLDLTEAEGLADLIAAETQAQRRQAMAQFDGALGRMYAGWRDRLVRCLAYVEAAIDFPDEGLDPEAEGAALVEAARIGEEIAAHLADGRRGERLRDGLHVAILGAPNVGKSSLINALAQRDVAIVTAEAGTTRDVIEVHLDIAGWPVVLADTAGLRETDEIVEAEGVRRAHARAEAADLRLVLVDARDWPNLPPGIAPLLDADCLLVANKVDLVPAGMLAPDPAGRVPLPVSVADGSGMTELLAALGDAAALRLSGAAPALTRERHRFALAEAEACIGRALAAQGRGPELQAEDLRMAVRAIGRILGRVDVEDILDVVFAEFCIGK